MRQTLFPNAAGDAIAHAVGGVSIIAALLIMATMPGYAARLIVTPYAETLPEGTYSVWQFGLYETRSTNNWRSLNRLDLGITDRVELGIFVINPQNAPTSTWINFQCRVARETQQHPTVSLGVWDAANIGKFSGQKTGGSFFIAAGKTLRPTEGKPSPQYLKLSLAAGTNRLNGVFGGIDLRWTKQTGLFIEYAPANMRLPSTDSLDAGVYHWLSPQWRTRASWVGGNPMIDVFFKGVIGRQ